MISRLCYQDILSIIAYGPPAAKAPAAHLLFYYWPQLNPALSDRRGIHYKYCGEFAIDMFLDLYRMLLYCTIKSCGGVRVWNFNILKQFLKVSYLQKNI